MVWCDVVCGVMLWGVELCGVMWFDVKCGGLYISAVCQLIY